MWYFYLRHSLQTPVKGLNGFPLSIIFHLMVYGTGGLCSLRVQILVASFVLVLSALMLMFLLCPYHLALNVPLVIPVYVSEVLLSVLVQSKPHPFLLCTFHPGGIHLLSLTKSQLQGSSCCCRGTWLSAMFCSNLASLATLLLWWDTILMRLGMLYVIYLIRA